MVMFGWGSKQRRIQAAEMDTTGAIGETIAQDKELTKKLLHGVPVPIGRSVEDEADAWKAAQEIGLPVVVKPKDGNQGKGVTVNIMTKEHLEAAFRTAKEFRDDVMVERYLPGHDYRLLVIGNKLVAARAAIRRKWWATASTPCANWSTSSMPTRAAARAIRPR
jgi:cyanophycin synthetase